MGTKESINHYHETLSEALQGVELEFSGLDIEFKGTGSNFNFLLLTDPSHIHAVS
jgi:transmembrane 9 superfamily protein 3